KLKMLQIIGKTRSRSACRYQKLSHHYEKATTRAIRHHEGKKIEGRSKGFRLNRPRKLVLKALVLPRRKMWWIVHGRKNKRNLHRDFENKSICDLGKDLEDILKGRLETIEEEPEAEEREWLGESHKPMLVRLR
ncbi:hypothetical protein HID58_095091, partial [Brassica napus]